MELEKLGYTIYRSELSRREDGAALRNPPGRLVAYQAPREPFPRMDHLSM